MNADGTNGRESPLTRQVPSDVVPPGLQDGVSAGAPRRSRSLRTRALAISGVAALIVGGSVLGSAILSRPSGSRDNLKTVLTSHRSPAVGSGATITVTGNGQVEGTPDTAIFTVGVDTTAQSAVQALERNNAQVAALEATLERDGVLVKNMQTNGFNLSANTNDNGAVTGFSADDELSVTMNDLANLGQALDDVVHATGNGVTFGGISFSVANQSKLLAAARAQAMQQANIEASQLAAGGGLALGPIVKVTDQENAGQQILFAPDAASAPSSSSQVPVQPGQQQISVEVTVVYQLVAASS